MTLRTRLADLVLSERDHPSTALCLWWPLTVRGHLKAEVRLTVPPSSLDTLSEAVNFSRFLSANDEIQSKTSSQDRLDGLLSHTKGDLFKIAPFMAKTLGELIPRVSVNTQRTLLLSIWERARFLHGRFRGYSLGPSQPGGVPFRALRKILDWLFLCFTTVLASSHSHLYKSLGIDATLLTLDTACYLEVFHVKAEHYDALLGEIVKIGMDNEELAVSFVDNFLDSDQEKEPRND
eukprot:411960_1